MFNTIWTKTILDYKERSELFSKLSETIEMFDLEFMVSNFVSYADKKKIFSQKTVELIQGWRLGWILREWDEYGIIRLDLLPDHFSCLAIDLTDSVRRKSSPITTDNCVADICVTLLR